mgnify:FL=1
MSREQVQSLKEDLSVLALELGLVKKEAYTKEYAHTKNVGGSVFDLLLKDGHFTSDQMTNSLSEKYNIPVELKPVLINPDINKFPLEYCLKNGLIPINETDTVLEFGICVPKSLNALKNIGLMIGKKTKASFVPHEYILRSIQQKHLHTEVELEKDDLLGNTKPLSSPANKVKNTINLSMENISDIEKEVEVAIDVDALSVNTGTTKEDVEKINIEGLMKDQIIEKEPPKITIKSKAKSGRPPDIKIPAKKKKAVKRPHAASSDDVVATVDDILSEAVRTGVSDIHIEIFKETAQIRFRGGGTLLAQAQYQTFITANYNAVIARIKILSNLDIAERRLPQDGKISYRSTDGTEVDFRISVLPTNLGERVVIRILDSSSLAVTLAAIGFTKMQETDFVSVIASPQGMVLVTGPTGSGKSTTLYGAMNHLNNSDVNILTAEDPVEYTMSGISQVQVRDEIGLSFASALRSFLRQDPEIILVGEIRDIETADIASKAALTGHLVLSTLHTNSAVGAISRLINMGLPPYLVSSALTGIVAQRLIRKNCADCSAEIDKENPVIKQFIEDYNMDEKATFMKGEGCDNCKNTGYSGRKGVHEVLVINAEIEEMIINKGSESDIIKIAKKFGFQTLADSALRFVSDGSLSAEEYLRVIPQDD